MDEVDLERMRRVLQHRLLNIVSGVKSASNFLSSLLDDRMKPREREYFPLIIDQCDQVCFLVERLDNLFGTLPPAQPNTLRISIDRALEKASSAFPMLHVLCELDVADSERLIEMQAVYWVLMESVKNANQASREPVQVIIEDQAEGCTFRIIDQGDGFSEEDEKMAFSPFYTSKAKCLGLGLSIANRFAEAYGGRGVVGKEKRGNFVEFYLPYLMD